MERNGFRVMKEKLKILYGSEVRAERAKEQSLLSEKLKLLYGIYVRAGEAELV